MARGREAPQLSDDHRAELLSCSQRTPMMQPFRVGERGQVAQPDRRIKVIDRRGDRIALTQPCFDLWTRCHLV